MDELDDKTIRQLFDDYIRMYASRDDRLTGRFSRDFSGFTGGGDFLVKDRDRWIAITRQDFAQVKEPIDIQLKDLSILPLSDTIAVVTSFFAIHLPIVDDVLSRETARLVLIFRKESTGWMITHSSISIPYHLVGEGEVYPLKELVERNRYLEEQVSDRTLRLSAANDTLRRTNKELTKEVAERKEAVEALQKSEERYRSILNASPDDITITDLEGRILMVSPAALTLFGEHQREEFVGRPLTDFLVAEDRGRALASIDQKRQGVVTGPSEYRALRPDGRTFEIEVNSEFMRNAAGSPTGMVVIVRDISDRKRAEAEKERLEVLNRQLQKVESLGRMAGAIAHHFNNKLQAVTMCLELAMKDLLPEAGTREILADALSAARKAAEVSGLMLKYVGQTTGKREALDLCEACLRTLDLLRAVVPKGVLWATDLPAPGPAINANEGEIQQVLSNLATNAWEAMPAGEGAIRVAVRTVTAAEIPAANRFPIGGQLQHASYACLEVGDSGSGIAGESIEKLFDPFFSSKLTGRGLGLPVALGIVRSHGGVVTVESELGRGSTFRVFLPVSARAAPGPPPVEAVERAPASGTVLVVDDDPSVRKALSRALARLGYTVLVAEDGVAALELFGQHRDEIGCVLCDVTMPRMDGWETLAALRRLAPGTPVILASGYSEAQVMAGHHAQLPQALLRKPYDSRALASALGEALAGRAPMAQPSSGERPPRGPADECGGTRG